MRLICNEKGQIKRKHNNFYFHFVVIIKKFQQMFFPDTIGSNLQRPYSIVLQHDRENFPNIEVDYNMVLQYNYVYLYLLKQRSHCVNIDCQVLPSFPCLPGIYISSGATCRVIIRISFFPKIIIIIVRLKIMQSYDIVLLNLFKEQILIRNHVQNTFISNPPRFTSCIMGFCLTALFVLPALLSHVLVLQLYIVSCGETFTLGLMFRIVVSVAIYC